MKCQDRSLDSKFVTYEMSINRLKATGISVVIPSYNHGSFIAETIDSLLIQNYPNLEIFVVDGGSTDNTLEVLKSYGKKIRWLSENDDGQTDAIRKGFRLTSKPWITWLNSDDLQCNNALSRVNDAILANPDVEVVIGGGHYMEISGKFTKPYPTISVGKGFDPISEVFQKGYMAQPSVFFARSLYERVGGLNPRLQFCMDYDLWARFALAKAKFERVDADISGNRWYEATKTSSQTLALYAEVLATQVKLFGAASPFSVQAVSDHLYCIFHSSFFGDHGQLFFRWLYFKAVWLMVNSRAPLYCFTGLFRYTVAKSGPVIGDKMSVMDWLAGFRGYLRSNREWTK